MQIFVMGMGEWLRGKNTITIIGDVFYKRKPVQHIKRVTFKDLFKKTIYLFLIFLFDLYFYSPDYLTHWKLSEPLYIEQLPSYYIDLVLKKAKYCCRLEIFNFLVIFKVMIKI